jgi:oligopeptide transport system substrate-binding protein
LRQPPRPRGCCRRRGAPGPAGAARLLAAAVALALAAGCTGGGSGQRPRPGGTAPPRAGGTLAIALLDPGSLDPARADRLEDQIVVGNLFDGLTTLDAAGAVRPAVAASWASDPALRRWEFRLRPDARWADGSPVRAEDFKFAWERLADPKAKPAPSRSAALLAPVAGYRAVAAGRARSLGGVQAPDATTLVVQLERPLADFPALAASVQLSPLPRALVAADPAAYLARPVGDGPFRLAGRYRPGHALTLERNPAYTGAAARLDKVSVHVVPDELTAWLELQQGRVAFAPVPLDQVAAAGAVHGVSADGRSRPGLLQGPMLATWEVNFDRRAGPAGDPSWRRGFSLAIDRARIAAALAGAAVPATGLVPPGMPAAGTAPACAACAHDPARAKALLAKVKGGRGPVTLRVPADGVDRRIAGLIAADLAAAGVKLQLRVSAEPAGAAVAGGTEVAAVPRMAAVLDRFSGRAAATPTAPVGPTVDQLLDQAAATADEPARAARYRQAEAAILADLPVAPVLALRQSAVLAPGVEGFDLTPWGSVDLAAVTVSSGRSGG